MHRFLCYKEPSCSWSRSPSRPAVLTAAAAAASWGHYSRTLKLQSTCNDSRCRVLTHGSAAVAAGVTIVLLFSAMCIPTHGAGALTGAGVADVVGGDRNVVSWLIASSGAVVDAAMAAKEDVQTATKDMAVAQVSEMTSNALFKKIVPEGSASSMWSDHLHSLTHSLTHSPNTLLVLDCITGEPCFGGEGLS